MLSCQDIAPSPLHCHSEERGRALLGRMFFDEESAVLTTLVLLPRKADSSSMIGPAVTNCATSE